MKDDLYNNFYDPSDDFLVEPRAFCYEVAIQFINQAKEISPDNWYENINTVKGVLLLLYTWNFAAIETKKLDFNNVGKLIHNCKDDLDSIISNSILTADDTTWNKIENIFDKFRPLLGQTGTSKALSLLNPELFVMWDTAIRKRLNRVLIPGIKNGENGECYVTFLKGIQRIIKEYKILDKLPDKSVVAKKIDEYHYVTIVMKKRVTSLNRKENTHPKPVKIQMQDNLRGRSIHENVIPTVCNLKNMLKKLKKMHGDHSELKQWEKRSYDAYQIDKVKEKILSSSERAWPDIIRDHILNCNPTDLGASCIDIYLVAYVANTLDAGRETFYRYVKENSISQKDNTAQAIWQVGKGDGVFLGVLNGDGSIKDVDFFRKWTKQ